METFAKVALGAAAMSVALATPAMAEGSFTSSLQNVTAGYGSRTWYDGNLDNTNGYVLLSGCTHNIKTATYRNLQWPQPDVRVSPEEWACNHAVSHGDGTAGDYHFSVKATESNYQSSAGVSVHY